MRKRIVPSEEESELDVTDWFLSKSEDPEIQEYKDELFDKTWNKGLEDLGITIR
jgi:hypothetical protein